MKIMDKQNKIDYDFLMMDYLKSYLFYHSKEQTLELMEKIIRKKKVAILTKDLETIGSDNLSTILSNLVLKIIRNDKTTSEIRDDLTTLLPAIIETNMVINNLDNTKKKSHIKHFVYTTALITTLASSFVLLNNKGSANNHSLTEKTIQNINNMDDIASGIIDVNNVISNQISNQGVHITQEVVETLPNEKDNDSNNDKQSILDNFTKCKCLKDILKRQTELESLDLTKEDKIYPGCKLSAPLQRFIYKQSISNNIPVDFTFAIIHTETRGNFKSSGAASYNSWNDSYDLGLTQQNTKSSVKNFCNVYKVGYDKACEQIQYNDYVNIVSAFLEYQEIASHFEEFDAYEYAGCYNGWLNWKNKSQSREYVKIFNKAYENIYTKHHGIEKVKTKNK